MRNKLTYGLILTVSMSASGKAFAIPSFSRQMNTGCTTCHYQNIPALNDFGRRFLQTGFTQQEKPQSTSNIEDEGFSLPMTQNVSVIGLLNYLKTNGRNQVINPEADAAYFAATGVNPLSPKHPLGSVVHPANDPAYTGAGGYYQTADRVNVDGATHGANGATNRGQFAIDGLSMYLAGRAGKNVGYWIEGQLNEADRPVLAGLKLPVLGEFESRFGTFTLGVVPFSTTEGGAAFGFELLNTGGGMTGWAMKMNNLSAQRFIIGEETQAAGATGVVANKWFYATATKYNPKGINGSLNSDYFRLVFTPSIGGWDMGFGGQIYGGKSHVDDVAAFNTIKAVEPKATALDVQLQGRLMNIPVGVYAATAYAPATRTRVVNSATANVAAIRPSNPATDSLYSVQLPNGAFLNRVPGAQNPFNPNYDAKKATSIAFQIGVIPEKLILMVGYLKGWTGTSRSGEAEQGDIGTLHNPLTHADILDGNGNPVYTKYQANNEVKAGTIGLTYQSLQNLQFSIAYSASSGNHYRRDYLTTRMDYDPGSYQFAPTSVNNGWSLGNHGDKLLIVSTTIGL